MRNSSSRNFVRKLFPLLFLAAVLAGAFSVTPAQTPKTSGKSEATLGHNCWSGVVTYKGVVEEEGK